MTELPTCLRATERAIDATWGYAKQKQREKGCTHEWRAAVGLLLKIGDIHQAILFIADPQKHSCRQRNTAGVVKTLVQQLPHPADQIKEVRDLKAAVLDLPSGDWGKKP